MRKGIIFIIFLVIVAVGYKVIHHFIRLRNSPPTTTISHSLTGTELVNIKVDYEDTTILNNNYTVSTENKFSGERSCKLSSTAEYGSCLTIPVSSVRNFKDVNLIELESQIFSDDDAEGKWVIEVDDANGKVVYWQGFPFKASGSIWKNNLFQFKIDAAHIDAKTIKIYPWNVSKKIIFIDDVIVSFRNTAEDDLKTDDRTFFSSDFEKEDPNYEYAITDKIAHSGKRSVTIGGKVNFSPQFCKFTREVSDDTLKLISASIWLNAAVDYPDVSLVITIVNESGKQIYWAEKNTKHSKLKKDIWYELNAGFPIYSDNNKFSPSDKICIYLWNKNEMKIFADDIEIVYGKEAAKTGNGPTVNVQELNGNDFVYDRYRPPYRSILFQIENTAIKNVSLLNDSMKGILLPDDNITYGNFSGDKKDEIVRRINNKVELYSFDATTNKFNLKEYSLELKDNFNPSKMLKGDMDGDGTDDLILFDEKTGEMNNYKFSNTLQAIGNYSCSTILPGDGYFIECGDYNGDGRNEIFIGGTASGKYKLLSFKSGQWNAIGEGKLGPAIFKSNSSAVSGKFFSDDTSDDIVITYNEGEVNKCYIMHFNTGSKIFQMRKYTDDKNNSLIIKSGDVIMKGNFDDDKDDELLVFNKNWRFDLKLIDSDKNGFFVRGTVDFAGYKGDENPKFYEFPKLIAGKFLDSAKSTLMCILRNCNDKDFEGILCRTYSDIPTLPNEIRFYSLQK